MAEAKNGRRVVGLRSSARRASAGSRSSVAFFGLVFALSVPFWLVGFRTGLRLAEGLPVSVLMAFCPVAAAAILVYRERQGAGVIELIERSFDFARIRAKGWYVPVVLLMPGRRL
jgi:hypothetical protein